MVQQKQPVLFRSVLANSIGNSEIEEMETAGDNKLAVGQSYG